MVLSHWLWWSLYFKFGNFSRSVACIIIKGNVYSLITVHSSLLLSWLWVRSDEKWGQIHLKLSDPILINRLQLKYRVKNVKSPYGVAVRIPGFHPGHCQPGFNSQYGNILVSFMQNLLHAQHSRPTWFNKTSTLYWQYTELIWPLYRHCAVIGAKILPIKTLYMVFVSH